ncbi:DNA-binding protein [Streptomyces botrytidirepellens]|uniref:DNA-binding protein n=2 Tax=Streptomyces botrytidirepellens TaxID=2486417 RepID=A0A3M8VJJ6_9ACTN|nr:DNA-binding protein [Streptomyces botrytidirepellens]
MTARDAQEDANAAAASSISDTTIDQLRDDIVALAGAYNRKSSAEVWTEARRLREEAETQRDRTRIPGQQQDLLVLAGQASALLATAAFDMGSLAGAKRLARTAALYGESARFGPLQAFAAGALAYISYFSATPSESVRLVQRGLMCAGLGDTAVRRLRAIEARAYGHLGDTASAQRALELSESARSGRTDDLHEVVGGEFGFSDERLAMSNSSTALLVGNGEQAEVSALRALELLNSKPASARSARVMGGAAADLAMARLLHNDLEGAAEALAKVWDVPVDQRATGLLRRVSQLRSALTLPRYQGAAVAGDLAERIEGFVLASSARSLDGPYGPIALEP